MDTGINDQPSVRMGDIKELYFFPHLLHEQRKIVDASDAWFRSPLKKLAGILPDGEFHEQQKSPLDCPGITYYTTEERQKNFDTRKKETHDQIQVLISDNIHKNHEGICISIENSLNVTLNSVSTLPYTYTGTLASYFFQMYHNTKRTGGYLISCYSLYLLHLHGDIMSNKKTTAKKSTTINEQNYHFITVNATSGDRSEIMVIMRIKRILKMQMNTFSEIVGIKHVNEKKHVIHPVKTGNTLRNHKIEILKQKVE